MAALEEPPKDPEDGEVFANVRRLRALHGALGADAEAERARLKAAMQQVPAADRDSLTLYSRVLEAEERVRPLQEEYTAATSARQSEIAVALRPLRASLVDLETEARTKRGFADYSVYDVPRQRAGKALQALDRTLLSVQLVHLRQRIAAQRTEVPDVVLARDTGPFPQQGPGFMELSPAGYREQAHAVAEAREAWAGGRLEQALAACTRAVDAGNPGALLYNDRAQVLLQLGRPCACISDCNFALRDLGMYVPSHRGVIEADTYRLRAQANRLLGDRAQESDDLAQAQRLDPEFIAAN